MWERAARQLERQEGGCQGDKNDEDWMQGLAALHGSGNGHDGKQPCRCVQAASDNFNLDRTVMGGQINGLDHV